MIKPIIYPYKLGSQSAKKLAELLGTKCVRTNGTYKQFPNHLVFNWGNSEVPNWLLRPIINPIGPVSRAKNKLTTFQLFKETGISHPLWTTDQEVAKSWIADGQTVMCRRLLNSHSGNGIVVSRSMQDIVTAPLYVLYKKKKKEFRVHVFKGKVIDVQQKRRKIGEEANPIIRSHFNGWIFSRENITEPEGLRQLAIIAVQSLNLDFGAVDIIWNALEDTCYCLEVNTAPGLEGTTLENYANAMRELCTN